MSGNEDRRRVIEGALQDLDEETARQRLSGSLPREFEEELNRRFEALSPASGSNVRLRQSLELVEKTATLDIEVPVASQRPGGAAAKRIVRSATGWYLRYVTNQLSRFELAVVRSLRLIVAELEDLRRDEAATSRTLVADVAYSEISDERWWVDQAMSRLGRSPGPVLVLGEADLLLQALDEAGVRADVASGDVLEHLDRFASSSLGAIVVAGTVPLRLKEAPELASKVTTRLSPGGKVLVSSPTPRAWRRHADPVLVDLGGGGPLHAETWKYLFGRDGLTDVEIVRGGRDERAELCEKLEGVTDQAMIDALSASVDGPVQYLVVGVRDPDR